MGPFMTSLSSSAMLEMFFHTSTVLVEGIKPFISGIIFQKAQVVSTLVHNVLRNFLLANAEEDFGFDLSALDLQCRRDHNFPSYNEFRQPIRG